MIQRPKYTIRDKGRMELIAKIINYTLIRFFRLNVTRAKSISSNSVARKVFSKCKITHSDNGFYYLNPMPTIDELNNYYSSLYWDSRSGKKYGVNLRDIIHYRLLYEYIPSYLTRGKAFLNFGAGHGGISNLLWLQDMDIVNIEPSLLPQFYSERWRTYKEICNVDDCSIDVVYGSHSLEHVHDIEVIKAEVGRVLKPGGVVFWEVPNADCPDNGAQTGRVNIPHTYYFETKFFEEWFSECIICDGYDHSQKFDIIDNWKHFKNDKGSVIRALGRI